MKISKSARKAILLGLMCALSYLAVYFARNLLSAVTPQMLADGYSDKFMGTLSSLYFITYAVGQLINGVLGDKIGAKYMIGTGLFFAGLAHFLFVFFKSSLTLSLIVYAMTGFFLAMIYGPMIKLVAENTEPIYATRCGLGYTFSSFLGSPLAGITAAFLAWQGVFFVGGGLLMLMAVVSFLVFWSFERRGLITAGRFSRREEESQGILAGIFILIRRRILKFSLISILTGVIRTSVIFWFPTYLTQHLGFSEQNASLVFSVSTFAICFTAFIAIFLYERLGRQMDKTIMLLFICACVFFLGVYFINIPAANVVLLTAGIMSSNGAASILWNAYCPSLRDTGMVSKATGFLDFLSYAGAAIANLLFADAISSIGWSNLILVWLGLMVGGLLVSLPWQRRKT